VQTFTLAATTWTKFAIPVPGDTAGTWAVDNTAGVSIAFSLASGTTFNAPATGVWQAGNYLSVAGTINFLATTATFYVSDVQLELGNVATPFEHLDISQKLAICQRYFQKTMAMSTAVGAAVPAGGAGIPGYPVAAGNQVATLIPLKTSMRAAPTVTFYDNAGASGHCSYFTTVWNNGGTGPTTGVLTDQAVACVFPAIASSTIYNCDVTLSADL
jgi:hypothetical protein